MYLTAIIGLTILACVCLCHVDRKKNTAREDIEDRVIDFEFDVQEIDSISGMAQAYRIKADILNEAMKIMDTQDISTFMDDVINDHLRYLADSRVRKMEMAV